MIRIALLAVACLCSGVASAEPASWAAPMSGARQSTDQATAIAAEAWSVADGSPAFGADDAFVFADVPSSAALDADALAVATRIDRDRMAETAPDDGGQQGAGRVGAAFMGFVALGPDGRAYASAALARGGSGTGARFAGAPAPQPSIVAMAQTIR